MAKDKTTYTIPDDGPQMASEPMAVYDNPFTESRVIDYGYRDRVYIKDGEVKLDLDLVSDTLGVEEVRRLLHKMVDLEYSLP